MKRRLENRFIPIEVALYKRDEFSSQNNDISHKKDSNNDENRGDNDCGQSPESGDKNEDQRNDFAQNIFDKDKQKTEFSGQDQMSGGLGIRMGNG
jgi:hypothetical protein